ncbi:MULTISPECIES: class I SAM-dependent methyltransferase [Sorangium]|uniref:class I SAM-dependent methyltransferase n=1 Tax=Sorangium TaxID=39643 RepID=UPI003D9C6292
MPSGFFFSPEEDAQLEATNAVFWGSLVEHIREDYPDESPGNILDIGCHYGGLLGRLAAVWKPRRLWGIEPMVPARRRATARLSGLAPDVRILDAAEWPSVSEASFELITCHEVLYLEPDLRAFMANVHRALTPSGRAYIVLGCHVENPVWAHWRPWLEALGHQVYDHRPMDILGAGAAFGLLPSVRPLRRTGWVTHDPLRSEFTFPSVGAMLDHHFKHKLLFRFMRS